MSNTREKLRPAMVPNMLQLDRRPNSMVLDAARAAGVCSDALLASTIDGLLRDGFGEAHRPEVIVKPLSADCGFQSIEAGQARAASGNLDTICAGLYRRELSTHAAMAFPDGRPTLARRFVARRENPIVAGKSAVIGLAASAIAASHKPWRDTLNLHEKSRVLPFGTEGNTDPVLYRSIINGADA